MRIRFLMVLIILSLVLTACVQPVPLSPKPQPAAPTAQQEPDDEQEQVPATEGIVLAAFDSDSFDFTGVIPEGWAEVAAGVYNRGDSTTDVVRLIQQAAPSTTVEQLAGVLAQQLGIGALPESHDTIVSDSFTWDIYQVEVEAPEVGVIQVDVALAETDEASYIVLLQAPSVEYQSLHEAVFLPAVESLTLPSDVAEEARYEHPQGLFSAPIPTNWTVEQSEAYAALASPDGEFEVYLLALESDDLEQAVADAWALVDPDFDLEVDELLDEPVSDGVERAITIVYDSDEDDVIVIGGGWLHNGVAYLELFRSPLETFQKRASQVALISTGYDIAALDKADLSQAEALPLSDELIAELEAYIDIKMEQLQVPGAAIAIVKDGELAYANGFGVRNLESEEPVTPDTQMMIGSTTKSMTTMLMAQLVDQGVFEWDTPVVDVWPDFQVADPEVTEELTMRNLVCACTGVPRRDFEWLFNASDMSAEDVVESLSDFEFFTDFGEAFQYSNQMVATGGYLSSLAAGGEYGDLHGDYVALMQDSIIDNIGMDDTTFSFEEVVGADNFAMPYGRLLTGEMVELPLSIEEVLIPIGPAGAAWSTVLDMAKYVQTDLNQGVTDDGTQVVSPENLSVTWEPQVDITADASYGLGWILEDLDGVQVISHAGNTFGYSSELAFVPELDLGISILTNQRASMFNGVVRSRLLEMIYQRESEIEPQLDFILAQIEQSQEDLAESLVDEIDREPIQPYLGRYHNEALGEMDLSWQDDDLFVDVGEFQSQIRARENDEGEITYFTFSPPIEGVPLEFTEDADGNPTITFGVGVIEYVFDRLN